MTRKLLTVAAVLGTAAALGLGIVAVAGPGDADESDSGTCRGRLATPVMVVSQETGDVLQVLPTLALNTDQIREVQALTFQGTRGTTRIHLVSGGYRDVPVAWTYVVAEIDAAANCQPTP